MNLIGPIEGGTILHAGDQLPHGGFGLSAGSAGAVGGPVDPVDDE